jgi:4-hydroxy-tetrahydrodipicolinate synthase
LQEELNVVRGLVEKLPVIPALKAIVAEESGDAGWATVRPPLVALAREKVGPLLGDLRERGFAMSGLRG